MEFYGIPFKAMTVQTGVCMVLLGVAKIIGTAYGVDLGIDSAPELLIGLGSVAIFMRRAIHATDTKE